MVILFSYRYSVIWLHVTGLQHHQGVADYAAKTAMSHIWWMCFNNINLSLVLLTACIAMYLSGSSETTSVSLVVDVEAASHPIYHPSVCHINGTNMD